MISMRIYCPNSFDMIKAPLMPACTSRYRVTMFGLVRYLLFCAAFFAILTIDVRPFATHSRLAGSPLQEDGWTALKTDDGILFVWNRTGLSFTLSIKGREIRPMDGENILFMVDGSVLQIQSLPISDFAPDARAKKLDDKSILSAHRDWESKYLETELLHSKLTVQSTSEKLANGSQVLIWQFDLPERLQTSDAKKQLYVTVVAKDYIILLNGVVTATTSEATVRSFLLDKMSTLKVSPERIDVKKLQEAIRKGTP
jgi:hypothetical protein